MRSEMQRVLGILSDAATNLSASAERIPPDAWIAPIGDGKWSPAEILEHLNLTFDVLLRELNGGVGMAVMTKAWQRILLKLMIVPRLLRGGAFPRGARAPRELRPRVTCAQSEAIAGFRERAAQLAAAAEKSESVPRTRLTHAYFGTASVAKGVLLCARHIQHHQKQISSLG